MLAVKSDLYSGSLQTEGRALVGNIGDSWMVGLRDLRGLFQP